MADTIKITLAQLNQSVGDLAANAAAMLAVRESARDSDLIVYPELQLIGYPPEDLIMKPALIERAAAELQKLAEVTADGGPAMLVGSVFVRDGALHNGVALLEGGRIAATRFKYELPNYGTFDEKRYFMPGPLPEPVLFKGAMIGLPICEDIWQPDVCRHLAEQGAEIFICVNGSPYEIDKDVLRIDGVAKRRAIDTGIPLVYLNRVGGQGRQGMGTLSGGTEHQQFGIGRRRAEPGAGGGTGGGNAGNGGGVGGRQQHQHLAVTPALPPGPAPAIGGGRGTGDPPQLAQRGSRATRPRRAGGGSLIGRSSLGKIQ
jgi:predicted amidohydrolase